MCDAAAFEPRLPDLGITKCSITQFKYCKERAPCGLNKMQNLSHGFCVVHWTVHSESIRTVRWSPVGVRSESIGLSADFHQTVAAVWVQVHPESVRTVRWTYFPYWTSTGQAPESHRKIPALVHQKNIQSGYPKSNGVRSESGRKKGGSVKTSTTLIFCLACRFSRSVFSIKVKKI